jgi:hypothetical protein
MEEMLSLYDYLGYAAGNELGQNVADYAKIRKVKCGMRSVSTLKYKGPVMLYTKEFIDEYFAVEKLFNGKDYTEINTELTEDSFKAAAVESVY